MTWFYPKMPFPQRVQLLFGSLSSSKFGDEISSFADLGCLSRILNPESECFPSRIKDTGSKFFPSWIPDPRFEFFPSQVLDPRCISKNLSILTKKWFLSSQKYDPGFPSKIRIPDLDPNFLPIPDPESRDQKGNGSLIPDPGSGFGTLEISGLLRL
jgi:hypothetical protein